LEQTTPRLHRARFYKLPTRGQQSHVSRFQPVETIYQNINILSAENLSKKLRIITKKHLFVFIFGKAKSSLCELLVCFLLVTNQCSRKYKV
jgi:hypothetical protein